MRERRMNKRGVTLIELLVALVIAAVVIAGIYRMFISQTKTYAIQDQVVEVQQSIRGAMEILLRDLRMTGFDEDNPGSTISIPTPIATPVQASDITVSYEYYNRTTSTFQRHTVRYWRDAATSRLMRQLTVDAVANPAEIVVENVDVLTFTYGLDANNDGVMDDRNGNNLIDDTDYVAAASVGTTKVVAIRAVLTGRPDQTNQDVQRGVSPRTLASAVTLRNLCLR